MAFGSLEGQTLGKYQVLAPLGAGGMARVYRAYHPGLDRYVAIKVLRGDLLAEPEFLARFQREARAVAALRHPNIVQVFDFDAQAGVYYMVMELLEGDTLKARLLGQQAQPAPLPPGEAGLVLVQALAGLGYAYAEGLIHRDLKPANLMVTRRGQVVLTDFGIAQIVGGPRQTLSGTLLGTLNYMAPEQGLRGECSVRSDLYALGIVLYEMLTGRVPFEADTPLAILMKHANEPLPPLRQLNPALPAPLERVLQRALSKEPEARYASAAEMSADLQAALQTAGVALPERLPPLPGEPDPAPRVISGDARSALAGARFAQEQTDALMAAAGSAAPRLAVAATAAALPATLLPAAPAVETVTRRSLARAVFLWIWALAAVNLLALALAGALDRLPRFAGAAWPAEVLLVALLLSLLMEALANRWLVIPLIVVGDVAVLLAGYALTGAWGRWFWWPLLVLLAASEIVLALRWSPGTSIAGPSRRARQLGQAAGALCAALIVLDLALALVVAGR